MIVERLTEYPRDIVDTLADTAKAEFLEAGPIEFGVAKMATHLWRVRDGEDTVMYVSVYHANLFGTPEVGVLIGKGFEKRPVKSLKACRKLVNVVREVAPKVRARVDEGFAAGLDFAKFFGFRHTDTRDGFYILEL